MKSRIHFKNIFFGVLAGLVVLTLFVSFQPNLEANAQQSSLLNKSGGRVNFFELAPKVNQAISVQELAGVLGESLGLGDPVVFKLFGQAIFDNVITYNDSFISEMFAGYSSIPAPGGGGAFEAPSSAQDTTLHANGTIRIDGQANSSAADYVPACVNDFGKLSRCTSASWDTGGGGPGGEELVNGSCGSSHTGTYSSAPSTNLCSTGTASGVVDHTGGLGGAYDYTWTCTGANGGSNASCYAYYSSGSEPVNGVCGSANGGTYSSPPTTNLCSAGTSTTATDSGKGSYIWNCLGTDGGGNAECSATIGGGGRG